ncbi:MAG: RimK family alpha-L-glutamate ligase [Actinobacteria bacterium]|nr:RimK family alpha-L-glutamate ligase [Actinomycetota bacterium]
MRKIGIISGALGADPTSRELLERASEQGAAAPIDPGHFRVEESRFFAGDEEVGRYDALIVRFLNPVGELDFQFDFLDQLSKRGVCILNSPQSLAIAESKFLTSLTLAEHGLPVPEALVIQRADDILSFIERHRDIVAKPLYGFQGRGVIRVQAGDHRAITRLEELVSEYQAILVQPFVPNPGRDIRAFVVGEKVVASIYRMAPPGDWKTNVFAGGTVKEFNLSEEGKELCLQASRIVGLAYTGVDLIESPEGLVVLEVNGAPAWSGLELATGRDIAKSIIDLTLLKIEEKSC